MFYFVIKKRTIIILVAILIVFVAGGILFFSLAQDDSEKELPILMYHSILKNEKKTNAYVITPESLENDMKYLKENGYETVFPHEVISYVKRNAPLPEKPVILSFDDGCYNNLIYLFPLLEQYDMKASISVVGDFSQKYSNNPDPNPNYAYLSWNNISFLANSGRVEILNHTYDLHNNGKRQGAMKLKSESSQQYCDIFKEDLYKMQTSLEKNCSIKPTTFVYPFGRICDMSVDLVKELGFEASFSCREKVNTLTHDEECLYRLGRFNRSGKYSTDYIMKKIGL